MTVVTLARRPLGAGSVAANVLQHGTGAIDVEACRIRTGDSLGGGAYAESASPRHDGAENWRYKRGDEGGLAGVEFCQPSGRWPANLVLGHLSTCVHRGTKRVESTCGIGKPHHRRNLPLGGQAVYGESEPRTTGITWYADPDGTELVEAWECVEGCPVADIDRQSGVTVSSGGRAYQNTNDMYSGGWAHKGEGVAADPGFGDVGGASRYFKQVGDGGSFADFGLDVEPQHGGFVLRSRKR